MKKSNIRKYHTIALIYHSFNDPLFQNIVLPLLKTLADNPSYAFNVITFEQKKYPISKTEKKLIKANLQEQNISWHPLAYHSGKLILLKKLFDFSMAFFYVIKIRVIKRVKLIFCFTNISASIGIVLSKILYTKFLVYCYEPHSYYMAELGIWRESSFKYKLLNRLEKYAGIKGDYVLASTKFVVERLNEWKSNAKIYRTPVCVDENFFIFKPEGRDRIRKLYHIENRPVLFYIGKFGDLYYKEEVASFCKIIQEHNPDFFFLIVTSNPHEQVRKWFMEAGLKETDFVVTGNLPYIEVPDYISAADIGLSAVPSFPSQKFRSPTKVAEYLLCGIPYITCAGVSEDDIIAKENNVGVVLPDFSDVSLNNACDEIIKFVEENKNILREKCRKTGLSYRAKSNIDQTLNKIFSEIFGK